jgi:uncharacterized membrane protein YgcG
MRRFARLAVTAILGTAALLGFAAPATALPVHAPLVATSADDFTFDSWHSDYRLGLTTEGRSTLVTTETIVARFPESNQNHGIRRALPTHYDGHPTDLNVTSVTDQDGNPRAYDTDSDDDDGDFLVLTVAADEFVHGQQTYVITYRQQNVTLYPDNASGEEFYWQVNGTGWVQPFGSVSATVHIDPALVPQLTGDTACFRGSTGSTQACDSITSEAEDDGWRVEARAADVGPREGLTFDIGFQPGTFVPRDDSFTANPFPAIGLGGALGALIVAVVALVYRRTRWRSAPGRPTIIAEYLPPKGVNLLTAGNIAGSAATARSLPAQFLSFAVRGNVRVLESEGRKHFLLELLNTGNVDDREQAVLEGLFPGLQPGTRRDLTEKDAALSTAVQRELRSTGKQVFMDGLRERRGGSARGWLIALVIVTGLVGIFGSIIALATEVGRGWPLLTLFLTIFALAATLILTANVRPLTTAGAELRDYLRGLKLYIELAESDRLRVLQSPQGALRSPYRPDLATEWASTVSTTGSAVSTGSSAALETTAVETGPLQVLKLYERVLPYAVLFGLEKEWSAVLGDYYARSGSQPDWYYGSTAFNAAYFAAAIGSFTSTTVSSWSGSTTSSSSSGFGGGGSVGGGGGGGGGGGV